MGSILRGFNPTVTVVYIYIFEPKQLTFFLNICEVYRFYYINISNVISIKEALLKENTRFITFILGDP